MKFFKFQYYRILNNHFLTCYLFIFSIFSSTIKFVELNIQVRDVDLDFLINPQNLNATQSDNIWVSQQYNLSEVSLRVNGDPLVDGVVIQMPIKGMKLVETNLILFFSFI
jgi:hypothetical protein